MTIILAYYNFILWTIIMIYELLLTALSISISILHCQLNILCQFIGEENKTLIYFILLKKKKKKNWYLEFD
jgi:hypothetical protein